VGLFDNHCTPVNTDLDMGNMQQDGPDYSRYTKEELEDVLNNIDKVQFPERYREALEMLSKRIDKHATEPSHNKGAALPLPPKQKWSEQLLITRLVVSIFLIMLFAVFPTIFVEFMTAKNWTENTTGVIWALAFILVAMWFICLKEDTLLTQRLLDSWRGKLAIMVMPLLFMLMSWGFIDKSLPLGLHMLSAQQNVRYDMNYRKRSGKKYCRQRVEILETNELENADLCMAESQRDGLPERGTITVLGTQSMFGMWIEGFRI